MQFTFTCDVMCKLNLSLKATLNNLMIVNILHSYILIFFLLLLIILYLSAAELK